MGLDAMGFIRLALCIVAMAKLYDWGQYDLPSSKTAYGSARKLMAAVYLVLIVALCWLSLLATQDAAGFAYFQF